MEKISSTVCFMQTKHFIVLFVLFFLNSFYVKSQNRNFGFVFSENLRGGAALFGNTLLNAVKTDGTINVNAMNGNSVNGNSSYDNGNLDTTDMEFIDVDGNTGDGAGTRNSSSADLILPAGVNTIKIARLYWGGRAFTSQFDMSNTGNQTIKIRKGTSGAYHEFGAAQFDKTVKNAGAIDENTYYQAFVDITALVQQQGGGTYTVGNGAFSTGVSDNFGNYGGWSIMVVYENPSLNFNSVRVYDGYQDIYNGGNLITSSITLTGLNVPSGALSLTDAKIGVVTWEGDARYGGDFFKINGNLFSNALNQENNFGNGTITDDGVHVTTKNPSYTDQMGIDIDQFSVGLGYGISPNDASVTVQFGTMQDQYFAGVITFVIKMKDPIIKLSKTVSDANNNGSAEAGEVLTYKLLGKNIGAGNANAVVLTDSLPSTITYVSNSLKVNYGPGMSAGIKTDAPGDDIGEYDATNKTIIFRAGNGANAVNGGFLAFKDSFEVEFKVIVNTPAIGAPPIVNVARLMAKSDALVDYVDDGTASINAPVVPLPVTLTSFTANLVQNNQVKVAWTTSMEFNSSRYDIERSSDGVNFNTIATRAASGNSSVQINYFIYDDIISLTAPIVYYRLKQIDLDGRSSISKVVSVKLKKTIGDFTVSPNPFRNNLNINIEWNKNETTVVKVFNVLGAEVVAKNVLMIKGNNYIAIDELSSLQPGNYIIQFMTPNGKLIKQVIKQK